jgi:lactam utilization protein B
MPTKFIDLNCDMGESYGRWTLLRSRMCSDRTAGMR